MTDCERLSDRMPEVALGRGGWSTADEMHLASCAECRHEWELVRAASRLTARAPALGDHSAVASAVLRRLRASPPVRHRRSWRWAAGAAAAAAIALALWNGGGSDENPTDVVAGASSLDTLDVAEVDSLLGETEQPVAGWYMLDTPTLGDLSEEELERVLVTLEG